MRTNIEIDDELMDAALRAGPYQTKKEAVEAGLQLVARQAAYRDILRWEGKLNWDDSPDSPDSPDSAGGHDSHTINAPAAPPHAAKVGRPAPRRKP